MAAAESPPQPTAGPENNGIFLEKLNEEKTRQRSPSYWQRLQLLFGIPTETIQNGAAEDEGGSEACDDDENRPRRLKVKIISWNMHDSIPKGNVEELLGRIPLYSPPEKEKPAELPEFEDGPCHPYHLVIVAGQECPTVSALPMGLAGFKLNERDKRLSSSIHLHRLRSHHGQEHFTKSSVTSTSDSLALQKSPSESASSAHYSQTQPSGWSYILEDWFCRGLGSIQGAYPRLVDENEVRESGDGSSAPKSSEGTMRLTWHADRHIDDTLPLGEHAIPTQKGPYELLIKERLMGIYLCIFVHRDARSFIEGTSKSTVATGLLRGRVGNKGGVGISVNIAGTRLLFVNAHLAAHEGHVISRLSNFNRIKTELGVDSFLDASDKRHMAEDITDRFDHTFVFGDLNFRLDVSRLHADWLVTNKEYDKALMFDQLRGVMNRKENFTGFREADINFPPTYKYDVLKTGKKINLNYRSPLKIRRGVKGERDGEDEFAAEDDPGTRTNGQSFYKLNNCSAASEAASEGPSRADTVSFIENGVRSESPPRDTGVVGKVPNQRRPSFGMKKFHIPLAIKRRVSKACGKKDKVDELRSASVVAIKNLKTSPSMVSSTLQPAEFSPLVSPAASHINIIAPTPTPDTASAKGAPIHTNGSSPELGASLQSRLPGPSSLRETPLKKPSKPSPKSSCDTIDFSPITQDEPGIYDSSSKQRVPSWCDRILWKTNVEITSDPEPYPKRKGSRHASIGKFQAAVLSPLSPIKRSASWIARRNTAAPTITIDGTASNANPIVRALSTRVRGVSEPVRTKMRKSKTLDTQPVTDNAANENASAVYMNGEGSAEPTGTLVNVVRSPKSPGLPPRRPSEVSNIAAQPIVASETATPLELSAAAKRWIMALFGKDMPVSSTDDVEDTPGPKEEPRPPVRRKGEVVCIHYGTLDDGAMRRLEGRSDHRPIFGSYHIYI